MHTYIFALSLLLTLPYFSFAQTRTQQRINEVVRAENMQHGSLGAYVMKVSDGTKIAAHNEEKIHIPASTVKAITTASALQILGENYQFKTELQYDGKIENGVLNGNLYIKGYGDPTLGSDQMREAVPMKSVLEMWVTAVREAGIREIKGQIVGDASYFKGDIAARSWQWADLGNYYASGVWGLNWHENFYYLSFQQQSRLGTTPTVAKTEPNIPNLYFINELTSAGANTGDNAYIYGGPYAYARVIRGTIPVGSGLFTIRGSIPDPPFLAAHSLFYALEAANISATKQAATSVEVNSSRNRTTIHTYLSPSLKEIATRANHKSINIYCESMIRAIGAKNNVENSLVGGIEAIENFWEAKGVDLDGFFLEDGSGLSARNGVTPKQLATMLRVVANDENAFDIFYSTLPIGGQSGTIQNLFRGTRAEGKIRAKSGSIGRVRAYVGYATNRSGELVTFAFFANNYVGGSSAVRDQLEQLMISLCE